MKLITMIIVVMLSIAGCSTIGISDKIDGYIVQQLKNDILSIDCKAGIASGSTISGASNANVKALAFTLNSMANPASEEYRKCFAFAAWKSFEYRKGLNDMENIVGQIVNMAK